MNENHAPMVLSDEVMIEIIHSIKDVLIHLTDALFPRNTHTEKVHQPYCSYPATREKFQRQGNVFVFWVRL